MAIEIKIIPTLKGKEAERFIEEANRAYENRGRTDFSRQVRQAREVLKKAKMKG